MQIPNWLTVYGDTAYRGDCPSEDAEMVTFFRRIRDKYPDTLGKIAVHVRNEGKRTQGQYSWHRAQGMTKGAPDIIIPGNPCLLIEMKRRDHTKSRWQDGQLDYLRAAADAGAIVVLALGADAAIDAVIKTFY